MFSRDPRVQLVVDGVVGFRYVIVDGIVEIGDDVDHGLGYFQDLRHKHGSTGATVDDLRTEMVREDRLLLTIIPEKPQSDWLQKGF